LKKSLSAHVRWCDPDFLYSALPRFACAAFCKESRIKFASATNLDRKSGGTWGTRPERSYVQRDRCYSQSLRFMFIPEPERAVPSCSIIPATLLAWRVVRRGALVPAHRPVGRRLGSCPARSARSLPSWTGKRAVRRSRGLFLSRLHHASC
jgi:hypothetical protein